MAVYSVIGYFNTGFGNANIPESPAILKLAQQKTFPSNWLFQNKDLTNVRLNANWADVENIDYVQIGNTYYFVTGITMQTEVCAELTLQVDGITTAGGISSLSITDGWCERAHTNNDGLFNNIIDEPFQPSLDLVIDGKQIISDIGSEKQYQIVGATIQLLSTERLAEGYLDNDQNVVCYVPTVTPISFETAVYMNLPIVGNKYTTTPSVTLYNFEREDVKQGVSSARSLGLDTAIIAAYLIPSIWSEYSIDGLGEISTLNGKRLNPTSGIPYKFGVSGYTPANNKVYALYNQYALIAVCTGDKVISEAYEVYNQDGSPQLTLYADLAPQGRPYGQFRYMHGQETNPFENAVRGAEWLNMPIAYGNRSGSLISMNETLRENAINRQAISNQGAAIGLNTISGALGNVLSGNVAGVISTGTNYMVSEANYENAWERQQLAQTKARTEFSIRTPDVSFPQGVTTQGYVGNAFLIYRTRMADADIRRLDRFFTMFGYAQSKPLEMSDFTNRRYFNYVQASGVSVKANVGLRIRTIVSAQLSGGVRVWHTLPNNSYYTNNPIK